MSASNVLLSFTVFAGLALAGDYYIFSQQNKVLAIAGETEPDTYWDYFSKRMSATSAPSDEATLPDFLPPAPAGWTRAPYVRADGETMTGRRYIPTSLAVDTTNDMLGKLETKLVNVSHVVETYAAGDRRVIISISYRPEDRSYGLTSRLVEEISQSIGSFAGDAPIFGMVKGVVLRQKPQVNHDHASNTDSPVAYRRFVADLGKSMDLLVVTNASDAEVQAILGEMDMVGLAAHAGVPESVVNEYRPTVWGGEASGQALAALEPSAAPASGMPEPAEQGAATPAVVAPGAEDKAGRVLDLSKPAHGVCVRRAGELVCP